MEPDERPNLATLPGAVHLEDAFLRRLAGLDSAEAVDRTALLRDVADVVNVFAGRDLLQFVFMPPADEPAEPVAIDLIVPLEPQEPAIAWFTVDEAGYDEFRDAVTLIGDLADLLNPPIVLDFDEDELEAGLPED